MLASFGIPLITCDILVRNKKTSFTVFDQNCSYYRQTRKTSMSSSKILVSNARNLDRHSMRMNCCVSHVEFADDNDACPVPLIELVNF